MYSFSPAGLQWPVRESRVLIPYTKAGNGVWSLLARDSYGAEWRLELECLLCGGLSCWSVSEHILRAVRGLSGSDGVC